MKSIYMDAIAARKKYVRRSRSLPQSRLSLHQSSKYLNVRFGPLAVIEVRY